jgi:retinol dehydrogenase 12
MTHGDLAGRVFLITGATEGIGKAATRALAMRGASITLCGRDTSKTERAQAEIAEESGNEHLDFVIGDLSRLAGVRRVAAKFREKHNRLDVLVNNAGAIFDTPRKSMDGFELTFALNHLAYFQLTTSLLDLILTTPGARVVSTTSMAFRLGKIDLQKTPTSDESGGRAYSASKLANILFTREFQRRLQGTTATANCFHPGWVRSRFGASDKGIGMKIIQTLGRPFQKTPEEAAETLVWLAAPPEAASFKGEYIVNRRPATLTKQAKDPQLAEDLWTLSEKCCDGVFPSIPATAAVRS